MSKFCFQLQIANQGIIAAAVLLAKLANETAAMVVSKIAYAHGVHCFLAVPNMSPNRTIRCCIHREENVYKLQLYI